MAAEAPPSAIRGPDFAAPAYLDAGQRDIVSRPSGVPDVSGAARLKATTAMRRRLLFAFIALTIAGVSVGAGPRILPGNDPDAEEIIKAATAFLEKIAASDQKGAEELFAGPPEQARLLAAHLEWVGAFERLRAALAAQAGEIPVIARMSIAQMLRQRAGNLPRSSLILADDRASLAEGAVLNPGMRLRRDKGRWIVTHLTANPVDVWRFEKLLRTLASGADTVAREFAAGKLAGVPAASEAINKMLAQAIRESEVARYRAPKDWTPPPTARWKAPGARELVALIGKPIESDEMDSFMSALPGLPWLGGGESRQYFYLCDLEAGVWALFSLPSQKLGGLDLHAASTEGYAYYPGELPHGITVKDTRKAVEAKIGMPPVSSSGPMGYHAYYSRLGLELTYAKDSPRDADNPLAKIHLSAHDPQAPPPIAKGSKTLPRVTFRLVADAPGADTEQLKSPNPKEPVPLNVRRQPVLDGRSLADVHCTIPTAERPGGSLHFELTPTGIKRLNEVITANPGGRLAMLLDGEVFYVGTLRDQLPKDIEIDPGGTAQELAKLSGRLHAGVFSLEE
jgi:hypothetical protein